VFRVVQKGDVYTGMLFPKKIMISAYSRDCGRGSDVNASHNAKSGNHGLVWCVSFWGVGYSKGYVHLE